MPAAVWLDVRLSPATGAKATVCSAARSATEGSFSIFATQAARVGNPCDSCMNFYTSIARACRNTH